MRSLVQPLLEHYNTDTENPLESWRFSTMVELLENEVLVLKALRDSNGKSTLANLARITELADSAIARSVLTLTNLGLVRETVARKTELTCTDEGITSSWQGLPERRVVDVFPEGGGRMPIDLAVKQAGLDPKFTSIVTGWITRKEWGRIDRDESGLVLTVEKRPEKDDDERFLEKIEHHGLILEELPENLQSAAKRLLKRNILEARPRNERTIEITQTGLETIPSEYARGEVSSLTGNMIASGDWEKVRLRSYNVSSPVPTVRPGKYHPYTRFLRHVKRKLVALGFQEVSGPLVEPAFINCDCLFMPQDHPAREIHDLYYLKEPEKTTLQGSVGPGQVFFHRPLLQARISRQDPSHRVQSGRGNSGRQRLEPAQPARDSGNVCKANRRGRKGPVQARLLPIHRAQHRAAGLQAGVRLAGIWRQRNLQTRSHRTSRHQGPSACVGSRNRQALHDAQGNPGHTPDIHSGPRLDQRAEGRLETPSVQFQLGDLETLLGTKLPRDKDGLNRILGYVKGDVDFLDEVSGSVSIEVKDSNHPDIWSVEG